MQKIMMAQTCINCGAPLHGTKCEYCGTEYGNEGFTGNFAPYIGEITVNGEVFRCYISDIEATPVYSYNTGRDAAGNLIGEQIATKRKITLIEC